MFIAICSFVFSGCDSASSASLQSEYALVVIIDADDRYVSFTETVSVRNNGESDITCLYFHLYGNKFCGNSRSDDVHIDILSISDDHGRTIDYDLDNSRILVRVNLPEKLAKGNQIKLTIEGFSNLPSMSRIYGLSLDDEIHLPMFYAQLTVFDEKGWHTDLPQEEGDGRYAECSDYDVTIIANKSYDMLCNGTLISKEIIEDSIKTRYICEQRRDLVICGSDKYTIKDAVVGNVHVLGYFNERYDPKIIDSVMNAATETVAFLSNALSEYPQGGLYYLSGDFTFETLVGKTSRFGYRFGWTMQEYLDIEAKVDPGVWIIYNMDHEKLLQQVAQRYSRTAVDWATGACSFNCEEFISILEASRRVQDKPETKDNINQHIKCAQVFLEETIGKTRITSIIGSW